MVFVSLKTGRRIMLIESSLANSSIEDLIEELPKESFRIVRTKGLESSQFVQVLIELSKVAVPSAISAISTYLVTARNNSTIKIQYDDKYKIEAEIQGMLNDKSIQKSQLYRDLVELIEKQIKEE